MKSGKNSKQGQALKLAQNQLQIKKIECLQLSISCQSLQNSNAGLVAQNTRILKQFIDLKQQSGSLIENLQFQITLLENRNRQLLIEKRQIEIKHDTLKITYESSNIEYEIIKTTKDLEVEDLKKKLQQEKIKLENTQSNYSQAMGEYNKLVNDLNQQKEKRNQENQVFKGKVADIERDKIQSIDIIKKQMMNKACQMRNKALEIRKEQFQTTTRLTLLQNDQLIRQLQFQTSKTENILKRNTELQNQVKQLKRSIQIHEGVEKQIMKRNVVAKNTIIALTKQLKLQTKGAKIKQQVKQIIKDYTKNKNLQRSSNKSEDASLNNFVFSEQNSKKEIESKESCLKKQLGDQLGQKLAVLQQLNRNLQQANQSKATLINSLKGEVASLKQQITIFKTKSGLINCDNVASLMIRFLQQVIKPQRDRQNYKDLQNQQFNLEQLKQFEIQKWSTSSVQKLIKIILNSLRPYLTLKILKLPYFHSTNKSKSNSVDYDNLKQNMKISKYVQALKRQKNRSLENIRKRSISFIIDENQKLKSSISHRKLSTLKDTQIHECVAKRFMKPTFLKRLQA